VFAEMVRANRRRLGLTQEELAATAGLNVRSIRKVEAGRVSTPRPVSVRLLADAFGLAGADREDFYRAAVGEPTHPPASPHVPKQLPADVSMFTGRDEQLAYLDELLPGATDQPTSVVITAVSGTAGVGKTALAVHWAHRVRDRFPDGQLYMNLRGYDSDQLVGPGEALSRLLAALGITGQNVPHDLDDRAARYRSALADRQILIVLDNAGSVEQVRPLLPGSSSSTVVVTSRDSLAGLVAVDGAHRLELDLLPHAEAITLLRRLIGPRCDAEPEAAATLVEQCARLPLALRVAAELTVARPGIMLAELVADLAGEQRRLDLLDGGGDPHAAVRTVFSWSIHHLPPDTAAMFRLLGLHPGPDIDLFAATALAGANLDDAHRRLEMLSRVHLIQPSGLGRYRMHDLLRAYAAELARAHDTEQVRHGALSRLLDHFRYTASVAMDTAYPFERGRRPRIPPADTLTPELSDPNQATAWLDAELPNLLAAAQHAANHGWPEHTLHLSVILHRHLRIRGRYPDAEALHRQALTTARLTGHRGGELDTLIGLGEVHRLQGRYERVADHYQRALKIVHATGDRVGELDVLRGLGWVHLQQGGRERAANYFERASKIVHSTGDRVGELDVLRGLGCVHMAQCRYGPAADYFERALKIAHATGDPNGELDVLRGLGQVHLLRGRYEPAADYFERALKIVHSTGNRIGELDALRGLGQVHLLQGRYEPAADHFQRAFEIAHTTGNRIGELDALRGLGDVHLLQGRYEPAAGHYQRALKVALTIGSRNGQFEAMQGLGRVHHATGHPRDALTHHHQALAIATDLQQPADQVRAHDGLAHAHRALDHPEQARQHWQQALEIITSLGTDRTEEAGVTVTSIRGHLTSLVER
jgi:tetratricopeptide (TPR) repeat protein/transcriptional regulator with XRE-family HTH domain